MTPPPPSQPSARPPRSRGARIVRSRYFLFPLIGGVLGYLQAIPSSYHGILGIVGSIVNTVTVGGVIGIFTVVLAVGRAVRNFWRNRNPQGLSGVPVGSASGCGAMPPAGGLMAGAGWGVMRAAARLMPRAAGSRWLAEAGSFLSEAPPAQRRRALRNYLATAPQTILVSWADRLARRTRAR